ncbi:SsrA-binding protein SmpB [Candidatus Paracaedibacter symbiosus]|uniref:SsrA-binding protein SmpB n=1 Tax=Candidatus Paracaedibacter symbiosus TaxID=244582 RepID=UPI00050988BF|nr:SsrA-binding protein SmpB [Candidatus Paracaedibacter symbiosus]
MKNTENAHRIVAQNRRARFDYFILEEFEAGIMLVGSEVKSLRSGKASINESHAGEMKGELYLFNANIPEYTQANSFNHEAKRPRKLLLRYREIQKLIGAIQRKGMTIVPLSVYFNTKGLAKVALGLAKGKNVVDKRETIKERDWQRDKSRILRRED